MLQCKRTHTANHYWALKMSWSTAHHLWLGLTEHFSGLNNIHSQEVQIDTAAVRAVGIWDQFVIAVSKVDRRRFYYLKLKMKAHGLMEGEYSKSITGIASTFCFLSVLINLWLKLDALKLQSICKYQLI